VKKRLAPEYSDFWESLAEGFCFEPEFEHFVEAVGRGEGGGVGFAHAVFYVVVARAELLVGAAEGEDWVYAEFACQVYGGKQQVAGFFF
jgi:hypothetical protein